MKRRILIAGVFCLSVLNLWAQDPQFTQFYAAPLYLNPAYTGADVCGRVSTNYRHQWPSIPGAFVSYTLAGDQSLPSLNSGIGVLLTNDKAGSGNLRSTSIGGLYAYQVQINQKWIIRAGIKASQTVRDIDFYNLTFSDQITRGGAPTSIQPPVMEKVSYFDVSTGLVAYTSKYWVGFAVDHLTKPNQSLIRGESILPIKYSLHAGLKAPVKTERTGKKSFVSPAINYRLQGNFQQMDLGFYYTDEPIIAGIWYRGIPFLTSYDDNINTDAIAVLVGLTYNKLKFGYSYDISVSKIIGSTAGAHEISLIYQFCDIKQLLQKRPKKMSGIPCPAF